MGIEGVDGRKTRSNHVMEMLNVLGIEAARSTIIDQIQYTMGSHGMSIDVRHIMLLADIMTVRVSYLEIITAKEYKENNPYVFVINKYIFTNLCDLSN